jgi:hypothetical protein
MAYVISVRDVVRANVHELGAAERALRVPYDLFWPKGAVVVLGERIEWQEGADNHSTRFAEAVLGDCHPGERVLLHLSSAEPREEEWWLCEVQAVDGVDGAS